MIRTSDAPDLSALSLALCTLAILSMTPAPLGLMLRLFARHKDSKGAGAVIEWVD
jgi:hypothetical protein